jgi:hypothetical protein
MGTTPSPLFFVSVDSKQFKIAVSCLDATLAGYFVSVDSREFTGKHNLGPLAPEFAKFARRSKAGLTVLRAKDEDGSALCAADNFSLCASRDSREITEQCGAGWLRTITSK